MWSQRAGPDQARTHCVLGTVPNALSASSCQACSMTPRGRHGRQNNTPAPRMSTSQPLEPVKVPPSMAKGILQCDYIKDLEMGSLSWITSVNPL